MPWLGTSQCYGLERSRKSTLPHRKTIIEKRVGEVGLAEIQIPFPKRVIADEASRRPKRRFPVPIFIFLFSACDLSHGFGWGYSLGVKKTMDNGGLAAR